MELSKVVMTRRITDIFTTGTVVIMLENSGMELFGGSQCEGQVCRAPSFKEALASIESKLYNGSIIILLVLIITWSMTSLL